MRRLPLSLIAGLTIAPISSLTAQRIDAMRPAEVIGVNVAIGAGSAALRAWHADKPILPALWQGAIGGGVMAGGMALTASNAGAARLAGIQAVALGASMARNAGNAQPLLSHVTLPLSPLLIDVERGRAPRVRLSLAGSIGVAARIAANQSMRMDWRESIRSGYAVFRTSSPRYLMAGACPANSRCERAGNTLLGTVAYADAPYDAAAIRATLAHESMHMAQHARDVVLFGAPIGNALMQRGGRVPRAINRVLVPDVVLPVGLTSLITGEAAGTQYRAFYEREARTYAPGSAGNFSGPLDGRVVPSGQPDRR